MSGVEFGLVKRVTEILAFVQKMPDTPSNESYALIEIIGLLQDLLADWPTAPQTYPKFHRDQDRTAAGCRVRPIEHQEQSTGRGNGWAMCPDRTESIGATHECSTRQRSRKANQELWDLALDEVSRTLEQNQATETKASTLWCANQHSNPYGHDKANTAVTGALIAKLLKKHFDSSSRVGDLNCKHDLTRGDCLGGAR